MRGSTGAGVRSQRSWLAVAALVLATSALMLAPRTCAADDRFEPFAEGLRQRRLFGLAEEYCRRVLADSTIGAELRGQATVELLRVLAEQAGEAPAERRQELVAAARRLAAQFAREQAEHPRLILVRAQEALGLCAVAEAVRREAELAEAGAASAPASERSSVAPPKSDDESKPASRASYDDARALFREGMRLVETLERDLTTLIPQRFRKPAPPPALAAEELAVLQNQLRYHLVRARRQMALCFAAESNDRVGGLATALREVEKTLGAMPADDPLAPRLRLEQATLLRLTDRRDGADEALAEAQWRDAPLALRLAARAERLRVALDAGRLADALRIAELADESSEQEATHPSPELDFARLELYLALWRDAEQKKNSSERDGSVRWEQAAVKTLEQIDARHGTAWRRRGDLLLVRMATSGRGPRSREALRRSADGFYLQGRWDDAIAAYAQAALQAAEAGDDAERFTLTYRAALVEQKQSRHGPAAERLESLATALPSDARAPAAHHLASWNLAQAARAPQAEGAAQDLRKYRESLERQIRLWPDDASTHEARVWLGKLLEAQRDWEGAADAYRAVPADSRHSADALAGAGRAWLARLEQLKSDPVARRTEAETAAKFFEQAAWGATAAPREWSEAQRAAALVAARAWFVSGAAQFGRAERLLRAALEGAPADAAAWRASAQALLLVALAGQEPRRAEAEQLASEIAQLEPAVVVECLERVAAIRMAADGDARTRLARIELTLVEPLARRVAELPEATRDRVATARAAALRAAGRRDEALAAYRALAKAGPRDGAVQETLAELLTSGDDAGELREALDAWRRLVARSETRSPRWFRAKLGVATAQWKLGDSPGAAQLIRFLQAVPPGLADTSLEPQFVELLRRCEGDGRKR